MGLLWCATCSVVISSLSMSAAGSFVHFQDTSCDPEGVHNEEFHCVAVLLDQPTFAMD